MINFIWEFIHVFFIRVLVNNVRQVIRKFIKKAHFDESVCDCDHKKQIDDIFISIEFQILKYIYTIFSSSLKIVLPQHYNPQILYSRERSSMEHKKYDIRKRNIDTIMKEVRKTLMTSSIQPIMAAYCYLVTL